MIVNRVFCFLREKYGVKYLKIDKGDILNKWDQVFNGVKYHIKKTDNGEVKFDSDYDKVRFVTNDNLPLGKLICFPTLTVVIRCVFKQRDIFYPEVYLDDALHQLQKLFLIKELVVVKELILIEVKQV